jgi:DNA-binding response OmpR family regulator
VVSKPVDFAKLLGLVEEALGQPLVLIVDDDRDLCSNLWDLLRERGYRVSLAHDGREASEQLQQSQFRVVVIDMIMPYGDGSIVFQLVRAANPNARTIVITGNRAETDQLVARILEAGADAVCYKPLDMPELLTSLEGLVAAREEGSGQAPG